MTEHIRRGQYHPDSTKKGPNGKFHCKRCGKEVPPGSRRNWCSKECVDAWNDAHHAGHQRAVLQVRDKGVCQRCGLDTRFLMRIMRRLGYMRRHYDAIVPDPVRDLLTALRFPASVSRTLWEADHTIPLVEGGDPGTANMRTVCVPCHRCVTAELAVRRAAARRAALQ